MQKELTVHRSITQRQDVSMLFSTSLSCCCFKNLCNFVSRIFPHHRELIINMILGTSLVVHWLRHQAPNAGDLVNSLVGELDPTCCS